MELEAKIRLRDYERTDVDRLVCLANNKNVSRYLVDTFPYPYTRKDAEWWTETGCHASGAVTKVIEYKQEFVGSIGITPQSGWKKHMAEIGYWIAEDYWGKGIAPVALAAMTEIAFGTFKYKKLFAPVLAPNNASMRVLEKCGYSVEGLLKHEVFKDGRYFDVYHYAKYSS